jgi:(aminoalkyl)phosphonate N-acetyltransferase
MPIRKSEDKDVKWIYDILEELRHPIQYALEAFTIYYNKIKSENHFTFLIYEEGGQNIGLISLNKFNMPRYLGYGYEMEEFAVHKDFRGKGYSYKMIEAVKAYIQNDPSIRKIIVKTTGEDSAHIYSKALNETDFKTFQQYLNKL